MESKLPKPASSLPKRTFTTSTVKSNTPPRRELLRRSKSFAINRPPLRQMVVPQRSAVSVNRAAQVMTSANIMGPPAPRSQEAPCSSNLTRPKLLRRSKSFAVNRIPTKPSAVIQKPPVAAKRAAPGTSNMGPPAPKQAKIPAYDFKARYHDLYEKHCALKLKYTNYGKDNKRINEENETNKHILAQQTLELSELQDVHNELKKHYSDLNVQHTEVSKCYEEHKLKNALLEVRIQQMEKALEEAQNKVLEYSMNLEVSKENAERLRQENIILRTNLMESEKSNNTFQKLLQNANVQRKILHNTILDLKGNIRVFCRLRPPLKTEASQPVCVWNVLDESSLEVMKSEQPKSPISSCGASKISKHAFSFDQIFPPCTSQEEVFSHVESLIQSSLDGYNVCIFAYGQTGSGKTFTMEGSPDSMGLIPRSVDFLFSQMSEMKPQGWCFKLTTCFIEIYNEHIRDLLNSNDNELDHEIRLVEGNQRDVYVSNIKQEEVESAIELKKILKIAQKNRITAQTDSNERSSRSHSVAKIVITSTNTISGENYSGTLNLVDLAGSESPKNSTRMDETKNINKSLAQLGKVILSLQQKQDHIPYRSSKLTFLLMPSLGGSSKTLMFVNINPLQSNYSESMNSLRFASQVNQVKTLKAKKNKTALTPR